MLMLETYNNVWGYTSKPYNRGLSVVPVARLEGKAPFSPSEVRFTFLPVT